ncbi:MAG: FxsA family protein [Immundisolibacteraceae bacterium]|nr:FxsA family protein [Immundisolibacteraceae bacterium]
MRPVSLLFLLFISVPIFELYLLISVGRVIGSLPTIFILVFTAVLGAMLVRAQGRNTWMQIQQSLAAGRLPATEMFEGVLIVFAGALLLTPGFVTDTVGFCCLIPGVRRALISLLIRLQISGSKLAQGNDGVVYKPDDGQVTKPESSTSGSGRIIEGELDDR